MIDEAIKKINPNAKFTVNAEDYNQITWLDGTTPISKADIEAMIPTVKTEIANAKANAITKKASGKQKLLDLGLSEEEVKALIGV
jgi:hypothetical protein